MNHSSLVVALLVAGLVTPFEALTAQSATSDSAPCSGHSGEAARLLGGGPHEPPEFRTLARRPFNANVEEGWSDRGDGSLKLLEDASAPGPPGIGRAVYRPGFVAGRGPIETHIDTRDQPTALYLSFWLRLSDNWVGHPSGVNKVFHLWIGGSNKVYLSAQGKGNGPFAPQVNLQGIPGPQTARNLLSRRARGTAIRRGQWVRWELLLRANTPGQRDASIEWWINGEPAGRETGFGLVGPRQTGYWERVSWNPTWGGMGGTVRSMMYQDIDEIYVSVGR